MRCAIIRAALLGALLSIPAAGAMALEGVININTATVEQLELLPQIGVAKAQAIVEHRKAHGPFTDVKQLLDVSGIGEKALAELAGHCVLEGRTTAKTE